MERTWRLRIYHVSAVLPTESDWALTGNTRVNRLIKEILSWGGFLLWYALCLVHPERALNSCDTKREFIFFLFEKEGPVQTPNFSWEHEKFAVLPAYLTRKLRVLNGFNADIICLQILFVCYSFYFWLIWSFTDQPCIIVCCYFNVFYNQFALNLQTSVSMWSGSNFKLNYVWRIEFDVWNKCNRLLIIWVGPAEIRN